MIKLLLYCIVLPLSIYAIDVIDFNKIFKKNRLQQVKILYFFLSVSLSYFVVNFIMDVVSVSGIK